TQSFVSLMSSRITGALAAMALRGSTLQGNASYSTSTRSAASAAVYLSSAITKATSWFWNNTLPSASTICTSPASVGIQARLTVLSVSAVMTATTPGTAAALVESIFLTRAWACGER